MKAKLPKSIVYIYVVPLIMLIGLIICQIVTVFYTTTTITQEGSVVSIREARNLTKLFAEQLTFTGTKVQLAEEGRLLLKEKHLWLQLIDENGNEIQSYEKPEEIAGHYSPFELLTLYQSGVGEYSAFIGQDEATHITYIIGCPLKISKVTMYIDKERYNSGKILIIVTIGVTFLLMIGLGVFYNVIVTKNLACIRYSLSQMALRTYRPITNKKFLHEIYSGLNDLDKDIKAADALRVENERAQEEWIANITHDLKTPLAPIRGYAELLADTHKKLSEEKVRSYGELILKSTAYAEELVNDLKLTYQLQNGMLPIHKKKQDISRFVKEIVIDLLNTLEFSQREISFITSSEKVMVSFDEHLLKRAMNNLIVNALVHNQVETKVKVAVEAGAQIKISIEDNGSGISKEELEHLFTRYYRGTNTGVKVEGTGLGMAIAKQIIESNGGSIIASSTSGQGTIIEVLFNTAN